MNSIRRFLVIVLLATITLINFVAALHGYRSSMAEAEKLFDQQLADIAGVLAASLTSTYVANKGTSVESSIAFQVWRKNQLEHSSGRVPDTPLTGFEPGYSEVNFNGYRWRAFTRYVPESDRWLIVAERADLRFTLADSIILESVLPIIFGLPLMGLLIWIIVGRGLLPLSDLAGEMSNKRSDDMSPVALTQQPQELAKLTGSINDLLRRLDASFERERSFAADAAHELRTPISVLKVQLHNLLRDAGDNAGEKEPQLRALGAAVERMGHSVEQVLMLYRTTPDQFVARLEKVDLASLARQVIAQLYPQLEERQQQIELVAETAPMQGDAFALQTLLSNLIGNASKYGGLAGEIKVTVKPADSRVMLTVEDSGPGIPAEHHGRVFERFFRGADERHDSSTAGSGIGLAIVQHIADIHGASISLGDSAFASGLAVTLSFPANFDSGQKL